MIDGDDIVNQSRRWIGTEFQHQGRVCGRGVDCAGLLIGVAKDLGLSDYDIDGYPRVPDGVSLEVILRQEMIGIDADEVRSGDVLLFGFLRHAQHLAIVTKMSPIYIIHAYQPSRRVVEHRLDAAWQRRIRGSFRFPGVHI